MDADIAQWLKDSYIEEWTKDAILDDGEWRFRILIYKTSLDVEHYKRKFTNFRVAMKRAKELIKTKGVKKVEVLPRGLAIFKKDVITIE